MLQRALQSSNSLNTKAQSMLSQNRSPRSNSRKKTPVNHNSSVVSSFSQAAALKSSSFFAQYDSRTMNYSSSQIQQTSIPASENVSVSNYNSGVAYTSIGSTVSQQLTQSNQQYSPTNGGAGNNFKLFCKKHDKGIEKICTKTGCEQQVLLCSDCYFDSQQHIGLHKEHMFNYDDFIQVCKSFSLQHKDDFSNGNRQLSSLLAKLDRQVLKYRNHVKKEEEKIDADFDALIAEFTRDMEEVKLKLKAQLNSQFEKFQEMSKSLKIKAQDLQQEKESNLDIKNDFDDFLKNVKDITVQKNQSYNFKKLVQNIQPLLNRYKEQIQKQIQNQNQNCSNLVLNTEQSETLSCFTGMTGYSYLTLNLAQQPHLAPIKDLFADFKELSSNKPQYKNKGEGQKLYRDAYSDIKRIYHDLSDSINLFLQVPKPKLALDFNKENLEALTIEEKPEIEALQFIEKSDNVALQDDQVVSKVEFIKSVNTNHKSGVFSLVLIDDDTYLTGSYDRTVRVFGLKDHRFIKEVKFTCDITTLSTLKRPDGSIMVLVGLFGGFAILNQNFDIMKTFEGEHDASINCILGLKDCETVITASSDPKIVVWNAFNSEILNRKYFDHKDTIYALELFPCGKYLASGGRDRTIKIWRLQYYKENFRNGALEKMILDTNIPEAHNTDVTSLKASKTCKDILFSGSANGDIKIWELQDSTCIKTIKNSSGWIYKFILFERPQNPESDKLQDNQENIISHYASPSKVKIGGISCYSSIKKGSNTTTNSINNNPLGNNLNFTSAYNSTKSRMVSPQKYATITSCGTAPSNMVSPNSTLNKQKKQKNKKYLDQMKKVQLLTASFDGTLKLWDATSDVPIDTQKSKHNFDCFPFGAVTAFKRDDETKIHIFTTGNKNDSMVNIWNIN
ncbi:hypothetical protein ABPG74_010880 [Tetrahymena malaccensis]